MSQNIVHQGLTQVLTVSHAHPLPSPRKTYEILRD